MAEQTWLPLIGSVQIAVDKIHRFGTDTLLLAWFSAPRRGERVCELGTGCGAIALRLCATNDPAQVHGIDIAPEAIALAQRSAAKFAEQCPQCTQPTFAVGDWHAPRGIAPAGQFDRVVCDPPYFAPGSGKVSADPAAQRARHERPGTPEAVCAASAWLLRFGGRLCLCHRPERLPDVFAALTAAGLTPKRLMPVQLRPDKAPWLVLIEAVRGGKPGLRWEKTLCLQTADGAPTAVYRAIYGE